MKSWNDKLVNLKDGGWELPGMRCVDCSVVFHPERQRCPRCGSPSLARIPLARVGEVISCARVHQASPESLVSAPYWLALIRLDGGPVIEVVGSAALDDAPMSSGHRVELVLEPLTTDTDGRELVTYRFRRAGGG